MAGSGRKNADERLLVALAGGLTVRAASKASGVSERTIYRRLDDEAFQQRITHTRATLVKRATGRLVTAGTSAVRTLEEISRQGKTEACRVAASRAILDHLYRSFDAPSPVFKTAPSISCSDLG